MNRFANPVKASCARRNQEGPPKLETEARRIDSEASESPG